MGQDDRFLRIAPNEKAEFLPHLGLFVLCSALALVRAHSHMIASKEGVGAIRLNLAAGAALGASGVHQLFFRNDHLPELGVFLANALVPSTSEIKIGGQARDPLQRETRLSFHVAPADMGELDAVFRTEGATYRRRVKPNRRKSQSVAESVAAPRSS